MKKSVVAHVSCAGCFVFLSLCGGVRADNAVWKEAANGSWNVSANWVDGVMPAADVSAFITNDLANAYTVTVSQTLSPVGAITLGNASGSATLDVTDGGSVRTEGKPLTLKSGGRIRVGEGGWYVSTGPSSVYNKNAITHDFGAGSEVLVDGGRFDITNTFGITRFSGTAEKPAKLTVNAGTFAFMMGADGTCQSLRLLAGARVAMTGGAFDVTAIPGWSSALYQDGGTNDFGGTAAVYLHGCQTQFGTGLTLFHDDAVIYPANARWKVYANSSSPAVLTFADRAAITTSSPGDRFEVSGNGKGRLSVVNFTGSGKHGAPNAIFVGARDGLAEMNVSDGMVRAGGYGLFIAAPSPESGETSTTSVTGTVNVTGGVLNCDGSWNYNNQIDGLIVGDAQRTKGGTYHCRGFLNVSGGSVTNSGYFIVGCGRRTEGSVLQTGGETYTMGWQRESIIGFCGGTGRVEIRGGGFTNRAALYVGGITTNLMEFTKNMIGVNTKGLYIEEKTAKGTLAISGGRMSVLRDAVVGYDGEGVIEMGGSGLLEVAGKLTLSDRGSAALKFKAGAEGCGRIVTKGWFTTVPGARLEVDVRDYTGAQSVLPLVTFDGGGFEPSVADDPLKGMTVVTKGPVELLTSYKGVRGLYARVARGSRIIIR